MAFDPRHHVIHTADGELSAKTPATSAADVRRIVAEAIAAGAPSGIVLNFHGGLVSLAAALETAELRLFPLYSGANAYPIFFAWESGFLEVPLNHLQEIGKEALFQEFVKKVGEWVSRKTEPSVTPPLASRLRSASAVRARSSSRAGDSGAQTRADLDAWFKGGGARRKLPARLREFKAPKASLRGMRVAAVSPDRDALAREIQASIERDAKFQAALRSVEAGLHPQRRALRMARGGGTRVSTTSLIDKEAAARLFAPASRRKTALSVGGWIQAAKVVADIVLRVLRRIRTGRDHGKYVTFVEEVLRELYVGRIGRAGWWDRMRDDTAATFKTGEQYGGSVFLQALHDALGGAAAPRITLIGHSTGAIFIGNFLKAAAQWVPDVMFDVILEAPAATHDFLAKVIDEHGSRIRNLRLFGMGDAREQADVLVPMIYPASLLYFVSGLLEDEPDQPIVGMERFLVNASTFDPDDFPNVDACRKFFDRFKRTLVWSPQAGPPGAASDGKRHQDFDDFDPATLQSVAFILRDGYATNP
jgi:hypothetical protein